MIKMTLEFEGSYELTDALHSMARNQGQSQTEANTNREALEAERRVSASLQDHNRDLQNENFRLRQQIATQCSLPGMVPIHYPSTTSLRDLLTIAYKNPTNKIGAIKLVRELTGCGLKDAKDLVEDAGCPSRVCT